MSNPRSGVTRRRFLRATALGAAATLVGCDGGTSAPKEGVKPTAGAATGGTPTIGKLDIGIIALTDCSPFVIAHEKGFFAKYGVESTIAKQANWKAVQDSLATGAIQMTHMLIGMPIASTMGLLGSQKIPMIVPWIINRNGQAITLKNDFKGKVGTDSKPLKETVMAAKSAGKPMTFAMTFPPGTHAMWIRYWLAAGGINPGDPKGENADVKLITIPPPQMVENMKRGEMDGYCVGEPWNARAVAEKIGYTAITTQEIWKDHPEKVAAFKADFAEKNPKLVKAALKALHEASVWLDEEKNKEEQAKIVAATGYINCKPELILGRMKGEYDYGDGRTTSKDPHAMIFSNRNCNYPQAAYCKWWLTQLRRWGFTEGAPDYEGITKQVMRPDLYEEAMKELGVKTEGDDKPFKLMDGVEFDPKGDLEKYAKGFAVHSIKG